MFVFYEWKGEMNERRFAAHKNQTNGHKYMTSGKMQALLH